MSRESEILSALTDEPVSTEALYERVGYATLARLGLIPYAAFRAELVKLSADGLVESHAVEEGPTMWRLPAPPEV